MNEIQESILKTVAFFDVLFRPLREREIFENLQNHGSQKEVSFFDFKKNLLQLREFLESQDDFWFLKGRRFLVKEREKREKISKKNWAKLEKIAKKIIHVPFLRGIFVSGSLAILNSNEKSDIDLLVITKTGRIFTVRFFLTLLLDVMGERRRPGKVAGKICLNHYLTEDSLKIEFKSLYNAYSYLHLLPILNQENIFERFRKEQRWMKEYIYFIGLTFRPPFTLKGSSKLARFLEKILSGSFGNWIEEILKEVQIKRKEKYYKKGVKKGRVILRDNLIELHPSSPEERILKEYQERLDFIFKNGKILSVG